MKVIKIWTLTCTECAFTNLHQPCEACPNGWVQLRKDQK